MFYAGIDIGGTKCSVVIGKENGCMTILKKECFQTNGQQPFVILSKINKILHNMLKEINLKETDLAGIGVIVGGPLDSEKGLILAPPNLPLWDKIPVVDYFKQEFGVPTYLQNDANACAVAEWKYGAGKGYSNVIFLTFGTGLGAGLILSNHLYSGTNDMAGEVGHIRLTQKGPVGYGKIGSFEGYCSGAGIAQLGRSLVEKELKKGCIPLLLEKSGSLENVNAKTIAELADQGDQLCLEVYRISGEKLGMGLSVLIDVLNPEVIIIGSIFTRSKHLLWDSAEKVLRNESIPRSLSVCRVVKSMLGEEVGNIAALSVATGNY